MGVLIESSGSAALDGRFDRPVAGDVEGLCSVRAHRATERAGPDTSQTGTDREEGHLGGLDAKGVLYTLIGSKPPARMRRFNRAARAGVINPPIRVIHCSPVSGKSARTLGEIHFVQINVLENAGTNMGLSLDVLDDGLLIVAEAASPSLPTAANNIEVYFGCIGLIRGVIGLRPADGQIGCFADCFW